MFSGCERLPFKRLKGPLDTKISRLRQITQSQVQNLIIFLPHIAYFLSFHYKLIPGKQHFVYGQHPRILTGCP